MNPNQKHSSTATPKTFQRKLILYNLIVIISIAAAVSFYNYSSYRNDVINTETKNSLNRTKALSDRLETSYTEMVNILLNCTQRKSLFLSSMLKPAATTSQKQLEIYASDVLRGFCAISGYGNDIYKITVYNKDGMFIQAGSSSGSYDDVENIVNAPWFLEYLNRTTSQYRLALVDNPFPLNKIQTPRILPLLRPLQYGGMEQLEDAWVFLAITPRLFESALSSLTTPDQIVYTVTGDGDIIAAVNKNRYPTEDLIRELSQLSGSSGYFTTRLNQEDCIVTYQKQMVSGLLIFEILPLKSMNLDHGVIGNTVLIIFFFCITIGLGLSFVISRQLGAPISRLTKRLELISQGDFKRDLAIETDDEIGSIGRQINQMSLHISELLDTRIQSEKEKKDLEIKMLQAQINPHFLYNTLDSIKWIATIQKNSGIVQVVTSLSSLLKNMAKGFNEKVTLRQELDFLQNYITIEKIRYIELFDVEVEVASEALYDAKIIKLTLQPIVENAIFSGIEPSGRTGLIKIRAFVKANILHVTVTDNGIGISKENIDKLLTDTQRVTKSTMSGIGLPNVDRRLKLVYGEDYGIRIESVLDEYTTVIITLPLEL